ncbi:MAG: HD domain-containing protein [Anaerolineales bacterium]|jgi:HD-GYP domain-containing protein (c-di-GMP phosphodiesterase class II)|nr:HD domain-containing protein [Anaerolineales bacterium]
MLHFKHTEPHQEDWQASAAWKADHNSQDLLIPIEVDHSDVITGFVVVEQGGFPQEGQNTLFDYAGSSFRESIANLTILRKLGDPTLEDVYTMTLLKLAQSIDHCNHLSQNHAVKTAFWARHIALRLGFGGEELARIELASQLHDIGKVVVPKAVLTKPLPLSEQEWKIMRRHPTFGAMIMKPSSRLRPLIPFVESHHENFDGTGYPYGVAGDLIPLQAQIISVADAYATITEGRVYRPASTRKEALLEIARCSGKQFDPSVVIALIEIAATGGIDDSHCTWDNS